MVTALFIKETLASAANDAEMVIEESRRMAVEYQERLEVGATCWDVDDVRPTPDKPEVFYQWEEHVSWKNRSKMITLYVKMGVSKNRGTPKSSILMGFSIINHPVWGTVPLF